MKMKKVLALILSLAIVGSVFASCTNTENGSSTPNSSAASDSASSEDGSSEESSGPKAEGTGLYPGTPDADSITVNLSAEPPQINTLKTTDTTSFTVIRHVMTNLVMLDDNDEVIEGDQPGAGCAESWEISEDGLTYTFKIREGMVWTDGTPVTANDFEFAWKKLLDPETAANYAYFGYIIKGGEAFNNGEGSADDVAVKAEDDYTLVVELESPTEYALGSFAFGVFAPVNQSFYEEVGADLYFSDPEYFCTNGPYKLSSWDHESELVIEKNEDYYASDIIAKIPKIIFKMITDTNTALNSFRSGEMDMVMNITGEQRVSVQAEDYPIKNYGDGATAYLEFNLNTPGLNNQKVRQAISMAVDREDFISAVMANDSLPATSFTSTSIKGINDQFYKEVGEILPTKANSEEAKKLFEEGLAEEGLTPDEFMSSITLIGDDTDAAMKSLAFVQEQFNKNLGVSLKTESMIFKSRIERMQQKNFDIVFALWGPDYNDPNTFLDMFMTGGGNNHGSYSNAEYDKYLTDAAVETDSQARMEMFYEMDKLVCEELPVAPIYWRYRDYVISEKLQNEIRTSLQDMNFIFASIV